MGSKYKVHYWSQGALGYDYQLAWQGQSLAKALWSLLRTCRKGYGCVKLEVRL